MEVSKSPNKVESSHNNENSFSDSENTNTVVDGS